MNPRDEAEGRGAPADVEEESAAELIERLLAKAELDFKCCGSHCSSFDCAGESG